MWLLHKWVYQKSLRYYSTIVHSHPVAHSPVDVECIYSLLVSTPVPKRLKAKIYYFGGFTKSLGSVSFMYPITCQLISPCYVIVISYEQKL